MNFRTKKKSESLVDITPLIDVVFTLLLFLLISTSFEKTRGIAISLPKAKTGELSASKDVFAIKITKDNRIFVRSKAVELSELDRELKKIYYQNKDILISIEADKESEHGTVIGVMDLVKTNRLQRIAISTIEK